MHAGERVGICGRTGSGKSTLFLGADSVCETWGFPKVRVPLFTCLADSFDVEKPVKLHDSLQASVNFCDLIVSCFEADACICKELYWTSSHALMGSCW